MCCGDHRVCKRVLRHRQPRLRAGFRRRGQVLGMEMTRGSSGNNSTTDSFVPVSIQAIAGATVIVEGFQHSCALLSSGVVKCWGLANQGQTREQFPDVLVRARDRHRSLWRDGHRRRPEPLVRGGLGRGGQVLGRQHVGPNWTQLLVEVSGSDNGSRALQCDRESGQVAVTRLCGRVRRRESDVLGRQPIRPARERSRRALAVDGPDSRSWGLRSNRRRGRNRPYLRIAFVGWRQVLGVQWQRPDRGGLRRARLGSSREQRPSPPAPPTRVQWSRTAQSSAGDSTATGAARRQLHHPLVDPP